MDNKYADGLFYNEPRENAPDFILGSLSINKGRFQNWLSNQAEDDKGYIKLDIKMGKEGRPYCELNTWKPTMR